MIGRRLPFIAVAACTVVLCSSALAGAWVSSAHAARILDTPLDTPLGSPPAGTPIAFFVRSAFSVSAASAARL